MAILNIIGASIIAFIVVQLIDAYFNNNPPDNGAY